MKLFQKPSGFPVFIAPAATDIDPLRNSPALTMRGHFWDGDSSEVREGSVRFEPTDSPSPIGGQFSFLFDGIERASLLYGDTFNGTNYSTRFVLPGTGPAFYSRLVSGPGGTQGLDLEGEHSWINIFSGATNEATINMGNDLNSYLDVSLYGDGSIILTFEGGGTGALYIESNPSGDGTQRIYGDGSVGFYIGKANGLNTYLDGEDIISLYDLTLRPAIDASAETPLLNSWALIFGSKYWDGAASQPYDAAIRFEPLTDTPTGKFSFKTGGNERFYFTNDGEYFIPKTGLTVNDSKLNRSVLILNDDGPSGYADVYLYSVDAMTQIDLYVDSATPSAVLYMAVAGAGQHIQFQIADIGASYRSDLTSYGAPLNFITDMAGGVSLPMSFTAHVAQAPSDEPQTYFTFRTSAALVDAGSKIVSFGTDTEKAYVGADGTVFGGGFGSPSGGHWTINNPADGENVYLFAGADSFLLELTGSGNQTSFRLNGTGGVYATITATDNALLTLYHSAEGQITFQVNGTDPAINLIGATGTLSFYSRGELQIAAGKWVFRAPDGMDVWGTALTAAGALASVGDPFNDSSRLSLRGSYWDTEEHGVVSAFQLILTDATPTYRLALLFDNVEKAYFDSSGGYHINTLLGVTAATTGASYESDPTDNASAIAHKFNTTDALANASAKLASWQANDVEKSYFDKDGHHIDTVGLWEDLVQTPVQGGAAGALKFDFVRDSTVHKIYYFENNQNDEVMWVFQMPHAWDRGDVKFHLHVMPAANGSGGADNAVFEYKYAWAKVNDLVPADTNWTSNSVNYVVGGTDQWRHEILPLFTASPPASPTESILLFVWVRRYALANANDTFEADVGLLSADVHYQRNKNGTVDEIPS